MANEGSLQGSTTLNLNAELVASRRALAETWSGLPPTLRVPTQFLGRQYVGCGATIGAMPRCDFQCDGCYLTRDANGAQPLSVTAIEAQLDRLRAWLGPGGNVQLTDGELTLRAEEELLSFIRYARQIGLVPMLMTHGESFRRDPGLFERLVRGGLSEVSFHIDTTMRGRRDSYASAATEADLDGLRTEFADLIRATRRRTGRRIEAASTVTVSRANITDIPNIVRWFLANADAFKMVSFQPVAAVGRTNSSMVGVTTEELWDRIAEGVRDPDIVRGLGYLGDPDCSRFVQGLVNTTDHRFIPLYDRNCRNDMRILDALLTRVGGQSFRRDNWSRALRRALGILSAHGLFLVSSALPALIKRLWALGTLRPYYFCIVSHHFMNAAELATTRGRERLDHCVFRVPIDGRLEPMCAVNALGQRAQIYAQSRTQCSSTRQATLLVGNVSPASARRTPAEPAT